MQKLGKSKEYLITVHQNVSNRKGVILQQEISYDYKGEIKCMGRQNYSVSHQSEVWIPFSGGQGIHSNLH